MSELNFVFRPKYWPLLFILFSLQSCDSLKIGGKSFKHTVRPGHKVILEDQGLLLAQPKFHDGRGLARGMDIMVEQVNPRCKTLCFEELSIADTLAKYAVEFPIPSYPEDEYLKKLYELTRIRYLLIPKILDSNVIAPIKYRVNLERQRVDIQLSLYDLSTATLLATVNTVGKVNEHVFYFEGTPGATSQNRKKPYQVTLRRALKKLLAKCRC